MGSARSLKQWLDSRDNREEALYRAYTESALSMTAMARELVLTMSRVSRQKTSPDAAPCRNTC
jgi:hypothetical protein